MHQSIRAIVFHSLPGAVNPQLIDQWDVDKNFPLTAWEVAAYDNRDYYWLCNHGHSFTASPANRTKGTGCPCCQGKLPVVGINDFAKICPTVAREWNPTKNKDNQLEHFFPAALYLYGGNAKPVIASASLFVKRFFAGAAPTAKKDVDKHNTYKSTPVPHNGTGV